MRRNRDRERDDGGEVSVMGKAACLALFSISLVVVGSASSPNGVDERIYIYENVHHQLLSKKFSKDRSGRSQEIKKINKFDPTYCLYSFIFNGKTKISKKRLR